MLSVSSKIGEEFQSYMDAWDEFVENDAKLNQINMLVDGQNFVMFFAFQGDVFGASEQSRVVFARMMANDGEVSEDWMNDASFMAMNLSKTMSGRATQQLFKAKDCAAIKIIPNKDEIVNILMQQEPEEGMAQNLQQVIQLIKSKQQQQ